MAKRVAVNVVLIWIATGVLIWLSRPVDVTFPRAIGAGLLAIPFAFLLDLKWQQDRERDRIRAQRDADR